MAFRPSTSSDRSLSKTAKVNNPTSRTNMPPSDFANVRIDEVMGRLTTDEAILLTAGVGFWHTHAIKRLGVPAIKVSDGPNGVRGNHSFMGTPAKCLPSATALGATWDMNLIEEVGLRLMASEAKLRAASVVLAPTCNIQRNPLGGRSFESFSEDPILSGMIAASYIKGIQKGGVGTTIKHFVGNDKEDDRFSYDSIISPRALREIYLMPFMLAQKHATPWAVMTAYNCVNGPHLSEDPFLLTTVLRGEWNYDGVIMSDWLGVYSVDLSINAGLDLEMPGVNKWRTLDHVNRCIRSGKLTVETIKDRARKVLELVQKCARGAPEILDGDGIERTAESEEDRELMRRVASESIVLLKNDGGILPLNPTTLRKVAIVGANAKAIVLSGGGSAALKPSYFVSPFEGIVGALGSEVDVTYAEGARCCLTLPSLDYDLVTPSGERGWTGTWHKHLHDESMVLVEEPIETRLINETRILIDTTRPKAITRRWTLRLKGLLKPRDYNRKFEFGLTVAGRAKLLVDGELVIDNWSRQRRGGEFFGLGSVEEKGIVSLKAGTKHEVIVEFCNVRGVTDEDDNEAVLDVISGVRLGGAEVEDEDEMMSRAVKIAKDADVVIAVVGLNGDWETEGHDRTTLALPGRTDELIAKVAEANPRTVVVTQSGSAITLPWADSVPGIVHAWYLGNASGDAIADVLFGKQNPCAKLSLTFPKAEEDVPSYRHFHVESGKVRYVEDLYVGYKHFQRHGIAPLFPFGHGLSYTTFTFSDLKLSTPGINLSDKEFELTASVSVTNTGPRMGSQVVQLYIGLPSTSRLSHPCLQLKAFAKVRDLIPGKVVRVELRLDKYSVSYWDNNLDTWVVEEGIYKLKVGASSDLLLLCESFEVERGFEWRGL